MPSPLNEVRGLPLATLFLHAGPGPVCGKGDGCNSLFYSLAEALPLSWSYGRPLPQHSMNSFQFYPVLACGAIAAIIGYALLSRKNRKPAEDIERERCTQLTRGGRIIDGNVIDVLELEDDQTDRQTILLVYTYDVAGVTYEASQDVTHLRQFIDLYSCRLGLPASVKYDPHNPGDSIVISESWSGLRKPTIILPNRPVANSGTFV